MPQTATSVVANLREVTNGARPIEQANTKWEYVHAVSRVGFLVCKNCTRGATAAGGRGVKPGVSS